MNRRTQARNRSNWRWLIPIFMLIVSVLACDEEYFAPPQVLHVTADADQPGRAFAEVYTGDAAFVTQNGNTARQHIIYETDDYGQQWQRTEGDSLKDDPNQLPLVMRDETLYFNDHPIWSFPRRIFRSFFLNDSDTTPRFLLPSNPDISNASQGDMLYVAMGTQGVLVGRLGSTGTLADWQVTSQGMDSLKPLPLTIANPPQVIIITIFGLFIPPYILMHSFLLQCLWVYIVPRDKARYYARRVSLGLMIVAAMGTVIWLTDVRTDFFQVVAVVAAIVAFVGVSVTLYLAQDKTDMPAKHWLILGALITSLIVPAGVATVFAGWWAVYLIVFGYAFFRYAYLRHFKPEDGMWREQWTVDRFALETLGVAGLIVTAVAIGVAFFQYILFSPAVSQNWDHIHLLSIAVTVTVSIIAIHRYINYRVFQKAKRGNDEPSSLSSDLKFEAIVWLVLSLVATVATFVGQAVVGIWFSGFLC